MDAENDKIYAAEKIVRKRLSRRGQIEYFVKWKGWSHRNNTWEPVKNILDRRLIEAFEAEDSKSTPKDAKKSPRVSLQSASNDESLNDKPNDNDLGAIDNSFSDYLTKKSNSKLSNSTTNGGSNETRKGKRKSCADSDTTESSSTSSYSRTGKNDRSSSSSTSSHSSRSSSRVTSIASRRRRKLSEGGDGGHGKENSDAKRKVQILSKVFPKETNKKDASGSRVLKQCSSNGKSSLLSDEALHVIKKVSERDSCDIFGEYVAAELRKHNERTRSIVQHLIHNVLFDTDMGKYGEVSTLKCEKANDTSAFSDGKFSPTRKSTTADSNSQKSPPKTSSLVNEMSVHLTNASSSQKPTNTSDSDDAQKILDNILHTNADTQPKSLSPSKKVVSPSAATENVK